MANVFATKTGNWSDPTVWNTGALPTAADDVYSNTFTVTVNVSPTVLSIRNTAATGVTAGGQFVPVNGITLTCTGAGVIGGSTSVYCFASSLISGESCTILGIVPGGGGLSAANDSTGTLSIVGNCGGGSGGSFAVNNILSGTINITGNCTGGSGGTGVACARNQSTGTINITGNCNGSSAASSFGASNISSGTINITGNCTGGSGGNGANNASIGTVNITGTITGGSGSVAYGVLNTSTGTLIHIGTAQASTSTAAIGLGGAGQVTILTGPLLSTTTAEGTAGASGVNPCVALRWFPKDTALSTFSYTMRAEVVADGIRAARPMYFPQAYESGQPTPGNVRSDTVYGPEGIYTGTLAVPPTNSVAFGVPVDNTTGTAYLTEETVTAAATAAATAALTAASAVTLDQPTNTLNTPGSIGERLKLASTVATTAQQLSDALSNE